MASPLPVTGSGGPMPPGAAATVPAPTSAGTSARRTAARRLPNTGGADSKDPSNEGVEVHPFCGSVSSTEVVLLGQPAGHRESVSRAEGWVAGGFDLGGDGPSRSPLHYPWCG